MERDDRKAAEPAQVWARAPGVSGGREQFCRGEGWQGSFSEQKALHRASDAGPGSVKGWGAVGGAPG